MESIAGFRDFALTKFVHTDNDASENEFDSDDEELEPEQPLLDKRAKWKRMVLPTVVPASLNASRAATHPSQCPPQPPQSYMPPWVQP